MRNIFKCNKQKKTKHKLLIEINYKMEIYEYEHEYDTRK